MIVLGTRPAHSWSENEFNYVLKILRRDWANATPEDQTVLDRLIMEYVVLRNRLYPKAAAGSLTNG